MHSTVYLLPDTDKAGGCWALSRCSTDAQGLEKPIIILSTAVTRVGAFVADPNRLNVAFTRAKHHLILV
jgi:hypothetical protein